MWPICLWGSILFLSFTSIIYITSTFQMIFLFRGTFSFPLKKWIYAQSFSCVRLFVTPWTVAHQAPLSMEFSRKEYWSGLPFPPSADLPKTGMEPASPDSPALTGDSLTLGHLGSPFSWRHGSRWHENWEFWVIVATNFLLSKSGLVCQNK